MANDVASTRPVLLHRRRIASIDSEQRALAWLRALDIAPTSADELQRTCRALARGDQVLVLPAPSTPLDSPSSVFIPQLTELG